MSPLPRVASSSQVHRFQIASHQSKIPQISPHSDPPYIAPATSTRAPPPQTYTYKPPVVITRMQGIEEIHNFRPKLLLRNRTTSTTTTLTSMPETINQKTFCRRAEPRRDQLLPCREPPKLLTDHLSLPLLSLWSSQILSKWVNSLVISKICGNSIKSPFKGPL